MIELARSPSPDRFRLEPLQWCPSLQVGVGRTAYIACGNGHIGLLTAHEIADDGKISPSVVCSLKGCDWHVYARLMGWVP